MLIYFSGFFLEFNKVLSPAILSCALLWILIFYKLKMEKKSFIILIFYSTITLAVLTYQFLYVGLKYGFINEAIRHLLPFMYFAGASTYLISKSASSLRSLSNGFINFNIVLLTIETIYRILTALGSNSFYGFKYNSFLYADSNFTALNILSILFFLLLFKNYSFINRYKFKFIILCLLLLLSFSRTAWFTVFAIYLLNRFMMSSRQSKILILVFICILISYTLQSSIFIDAYNDPSFKTKIYIFEGFIEFLNNDLKGVLFGYGSGNLVDIIGRQSHNIWGLTIEMGIIWLSGFLITFIYIFKSFGKNSIILLSPALMSGIFSLYPLAYMSIYFTGLALLYTIEKSYIK